MMNFKLSILFLAIVSTASNSAIAQSSFLSYDNKTETHPKQVELDWDVVKGDLTQRMWCDTKTDLFNELDLNKDKYLNKRDLAEINVETIKYWSIKTIREIFDHWSPNFEEHFNAIKTNLELVEQESKELNITQDAFASIEKSMEQLGINALSKTKVYIESSYNYDSIDIISEGFTESGRKWITTKTPVELIIHNGSEEKKYNFNVLLVGVAKFKQHQQDDSIALVEMGLN